MCKMALLVLTTLALMPIIVRADDRKGPFGFHEGMTKAQIIALLGEGTLKPAKNENWYVTDKAPRPHPLFAQYNLCISPQSGLVKLFGMTKRIPTSPFGDVMQEQFAKLRDQVAQVYGKYEEFNFLMPGSIWNEPRDWMKGLQKQERKLVCFWRKETNADLKNGIVEVKLEGHALDETTGILILTYEFKGFNEYERAQKNAF